MTEFAATYISAIASELGEIHPISDLTDDQVLLDSFRAEGAANVRISDATPLQLALTSSAETLTRAGCEHLDLVAISTRNTRFSARPGINRFVSRLGRPVGASFAIGGQGCGNFGVAVRALHGLRSAEGEGTALLVLVNVFRGTAERLLAVNSATVSDGAASCVLTGAPAGPSFRVLGVRAAARSSFDAAGIVDLVPTPSLTRAGYTTVRTLVDALVHDLGFDAADLRVVVVNNYGRRVQRFYAAAAGVDAGLVFDGNVAANGHCHAADPLINLGTIATEGRLRSGELVLVINDGLTCWSAVALEFDDGS